MTTTEDNSDEQKTTHKRGARGCVYHYETARGKRWAFSIDCGRYPNGQRRQISRKGFKLKGDAQEHGYTLRDGTFTSIDFPGAVGTDGDGIGPNGEVVGQWFDQAGQAHGYVLDKQGKFTQVDVPGYQTLVTQITSGRMIGDYTKDFTTVHGFVVKNGKFQSIDFPAYGVFPACQTSFVSGLNPEGDIVGGCIRGFLDENGWLVKDGEYVPINYPNSLSTYANGINPQGQIVGRYSINDGHFNHGFLLTWQP
jgi:hypothetical protein